MDLVSVPGVAGPNLAPRITFSYAPVNMQALADGTHVGRDAGHSGHAHGHTHGAHGHGHGHSHGAHGHSHAHTASHQLPGPAMPPTHQTHAHQQPAAAHSHSHGQEHTSASGKCKYVCLQQYSPDCIARRESLILRRKEASELAKILMDKYCISLFISV